jgi:hypothetical protein
MQRPTAEEQSLSCGKRAAVQHWQCASWPRSMPAPHSLLALPCARPCPEKNRGKRHTMSTGRSSTRVRSAFVVSEIACPNRGEAVPNWLFRHSLKVMFQGFPRLAPMANRTAKTCVPPHVFNTALGVCTAIRSSRSHAMQNKIPVHRSSLPLTGRSWQLTET